MKRSILLLLLSVSACHSDTNDTSISNSEPLMSKEEVILHDVEQRSTERKKTQLTELNTQRNNELLTKKTSFKLNNEKFTAEKPVLYKGDRVYNLLMSEFGVLKGTFVVVTRADTTECYLEHYQSKLIAKNTFRLTPIATDSSLVDLYKQLKKVERFSVVEIEIDYSKQKSTPSAY
jgi:hypothetical protein